MRSANSNKKMSKKKFKELPIFKNRKIEIFIVDRNIKNGYVNKYILYLLIISN